MKPPRTPVTLPGDSLFLVLTCLSLGAAEPAGPAAGLTAGALSGQESPVSQSTAPDKMGSRAHVTPPASGLRAEALSAGAGYIPDSKYVLRAGDRVSFQILEDRDGARSLVVADSGEIDFPYVGRTAASGKTCKQLCDELRPVLEREYYYRATLILAVDVATRAIGRVYVWGQVKNQGAIELQLNENLTVGKAILRAGGFADFAGRKKVKLVRVKPGEAGTRQVFELNLVEILEEGRAERDMAVQPEDSIIVPSRLINF